MNMKRRTTYVSMALVFFFGAIEYAVILPTLFLYLQTTFKAEQYFLGIVLSAFSFMGMVSSPICGIIADKTRRGKPIIMFALLFEVAGNIMYFIGISKWMVLASRLTAGISSGSEAVIIAELSRATSVKQRTGILSIFIAFRQFGILIGPAFNFFLRLFDFYIGPFHINNFTAPGMFMACLWLLLEVLILFMYHGLPVVDEAGNVKGETSDSKDANTQKNESDALIVKDCPATTYGSCEHVYLSNDCLNVSATSNSHIHNRDLNDLSKDNKNNFPNITADINVNNRNIETPKINLKNLGSDDALDSITNPCKNDNDQLRRKASFFKSSSSDDVGSFISAAEFLDVEQAETTKDSVTENSSFLSLDLVADNMGKTNNSGILGNSSLEKVRSESKVDSAEFYDCISENSNHDAEETPDKCDREDMEHVCHIGNNGKYSKLADSNEHETKPNANSIKTSHQNTKSVSDNVDGYLTPKDTNLIVLDNENANEAYNSSKSFHPSEISSSENESILFKPGGKNKFSDLNVNTNIQNSQKSGKVNTDCKFTPDLAAVENPKSHLFLNNTSSRTRNTNHNAISPKTKSDSGYDVPFEEHGRSKLPDNSVNLQQNSNQNTNEKMSQRSSQDIPDEIQENKVEITSEPNRLRYFLNIFIREEVVALLAIQFVLLFNQIALETMVTPITNKVLGWGEVGNSILYSCAALEVICVYFLVMWISRRCQDRSLILFGIIVLSIATIFLTWAIPDCKNRSYVVNVVRFAIGVILDMLAIPFIFVCSTSLYSKKVNANVQGLAQGVRRSVVSLSAILAPLWAGSTYAKPYLMFGVMVFLNTLAVVLLVCSYKRLYVAEISEPPASIADDNVSHTDEKSPLLQKTSNASQQV